MLVLRRRRLGRVTATIVAAVLAVGVLGAAPANSDLTVLPRDERAPAAAAPNGKRVVAISVDGLTPLALSRLGRARAPYLHRLILDEGAGTTNARTQVEMTITLPNHTSMVTGRRITRSAGGHGVTWNDDRVDRTVQQAAGHDVSSVFSVVHRAGGRTAVFSTKAKFSLFQRSWPHAVHRSYIRVERNEVVTRALRADLADQRRDFYFLHLGLPDQVGHHDGWMSPRYLDAVATVDRLVGSLMQQIRADADLRADTVVILTSDHGGIPGTTRHSDPTRWQDYRVPFAFWGADVVNEPLYALNPTRATPGLTRPSVTAVRQPIRNGELANASLDVLGLGPVPGSRWDAAQDLAWR